MYSAGTLHRGRRFIDTCLVISLLAHPSGHFQTIWCSLGDFEKQDIIDYTRTLIEAPDGGTM